jgi:hypothetical protein
MGATSTATGNRALEQALDEALPDNPSNPTLPALKLQVRQFMSRQDAHGLRMSPSVSQAMFGVRDSIDANPQLANGELIRSVTHTAIFESREGGIARNVAQQALEKIIEKRPDLADATLAKSVTQIAMNDPDSWVRAQAQKTLGTIAGTRPDLVDADMVKVVSRTAASSFVSRGEDVDHWLQSGGTLNNWPDNEARSTAQQTLKTIAEKKPQLIPKSDAPASAKQHLAMTPHVRMPAPPHI